MKTKMILFLMAILFLILGGVGCEKEITRDNVPFNECECDEKEIISSNITGNNGENAILFKTTSEIGQIQISSALLHQPSIVGFRTVKVH